MVRSSNANGGHLFIQNLPEILHEILKNANTVMILKILN